MIPSPRSSPPTHDARRHKPLAAVLVLVTTFGLLGCTGAGGDPEPDSTATAAASTPGPTPAPSRSPKPERPAAMDDVTVDGAIAAATYFISLYPYVYNTGDLSEWKSLSHPECLTCAGIVTEVEEMHGLGQRVEGAAVSVSDISAVELIPGSSFSVEMHMTQGPTAVVDSAGKTQSEQLESLASKPLIIVVHESDRWLVRALDNQTPDA